MTTHLHVDLLDAPVVEVVAERHHAHLVKGRWDARLIAQCPIKLELLVGEVYKSSAACRANERSQSFLVDHVESPRAIVVEYGLEGSLHSAERIHPSIKHDNFRLIA